MMGWFGGLINERMRSRSDKKLQVRRNLMETDISAIHHRCWERLRCHLHLHAIVCALFRKDLLVRRSVCERRKERSDATPWQSK